MRRACLCTGLNNQVVHRHPGRAASCGRGRLPADGHLPFWPCAPANSAAPRELQLSTCLPTNTASPCHSGFKRDPGPARLSPPVPRKQFRHSRRPGGPGWSISTRWCAGTNNLTYTLIYAGPDSSYVKPSGSVLLRQMARSIPANRTAPTTLTLTNNTTSSPELFVPAPGPCHRRQLSHTTVRFRSVKQRLGCRPWGTDVLQLPREPSGRSSFYRTGWPTAPPVICPTA